jgi:hypothetical protein
MEPRLINFVVGIAVGYVLGRWGRQLRFLLRRE